MKKCILFSIHIIMFSTMLMAQQPAILNDASGKPAYVALKTPDTTYIHHFTGEIPAHISFDKGCEFSPKEYFDRSSGGVNIREFSLDSIDPGLLPEADLPYQVTYSTDGTKIIVLYHHSNNVVVYDSENYNVLSDIKVGEGPEGMHINKEHIYVACFYSNEIYVINLADFSITEIIAVQEHPCLVEVNANESILYVGFSIGDHAKMGCLVAYDMSSHELLWESNWPMIDDVAMLSGTIGRKVYTMSDFMLIGEDQYVATQKKPGTSAVILDAVTGEMVATFAKNGENVANLKTSVTKDTLFIQTHNSDIMGFYRVDAFTHETIDSVIIVNPVPMVAFYEWQKTLGANYSGSKMFLEILNLYTAGVSVLVDFETHSYEIIEHGGNSLFQVNVIQSHDLRYVISMEEDFRIFDFELEEYVYFEENASMFYNYKVMAPSPTSYEFIWCDFLGNYSLTTLKQDETINVFNYEDPTDLHIDTTIVCGSSPEADLTYDVVWDDVHNLILTANPLSGTVSVIDALTYHVDTILNLPGISSIEQVSDDLLLMGGRDHSYLELLDIPSRTVIKKFILKDAHTILASPDQQYAYAFSRAQSSIVKIHLDGINSSITDQLSIQDYYGYYLTWEYSYSPGLSPDGKHIVLGQQNTAVVIDTDSLEVVCNVPVAGDYFYDMVFSHDSKRVGIVYGFSDSRYDIVYLDGENSYLEHAIFGYDGYGGLSIAYSVVEKSFYIAREDYDIWVFDPSAGEVTDTLHLSPNSYQLDMTIDPQGIPIVQTFRHLHYGEQNYYLGEPAREMIMDHDGQRCLIPCPGPDRVIVMDFLTTEVHEINIGRDNPGVTIYPNPFCDTFTLDVDANRYDVRVFGTDGRLVIEKTSAARSMTLDLSDMSKGVYYVEVRGEGWKHTEKVVRCD